MVDAILGALGLPDIGQIFPDTDPKWKGAASSVFMKEAVRVLRFFIFNLELIILLIPFFVMLLWFWLYIIRSLMRRGSLGFLGNGRWKILGRLDVHQFASDLKSRIDWIVFPIGLFGSS